MEAVESFDLEGFVQEGLVEGLTGAKVGGKGETFDFPDLAAHRDRLGELYGREGLDRLLMADAKSVQGRCLDDNVPAHCRRHGLSVIVVRRRRSSRSRGSRCTSKQRPCTLLASAIDIP